MRKYGFDIGGTIADRGKPKQDALQVVRRIVQELSPESYIVSRVNEDQKVRALAWFEKEGILEQLGIPIERVHWCEERHQKAAIIKEVGITHFFDDRPEVMYHVSANVKKILLAPDPFDLFKYALTLSNYTVCPNWVAVETLVFDPRWI